MGLFPKLLHTIAGSRSKASFFEKKIGHPTHIGFLIDILDYLLNIIALLHENGMTMGY